MFGHSINEEVKYRAGCEMRCVSEDCTIPHQKNINKRERQQNKMLSDKKDRRRKFVVLNMLKGKTNYKSVVSFD